MSNILFEILESRKKSLEQQFKKLNALDKKSKDQNRGSLSSAIKVNNGISIISEIKPASPTLGEIRNEINIPELVHIMEESGVIGLSILTEPKYFSGSFSNLYLASEESNLPCLMKDFVFCDTQFKIAQDLGATNILLINLLGNLEEMLELAQEFNLEPLIEIHNIEEIKDIEHLKEIGMKLNLIGVNNRNLKTLEIDLSVSEVLIPEIKRLFDDNIIVISESGINSLEDIKYLQSYGADAFLIGSSIMKSENIKKKILSLRGII
ncbi:MAG: indole-3-glycerol-phosphate synthase [Promethearchaeota archaeon]